jgi:hypothetical protein
MRLTTVLCSAAISAGLIAGGVQAAGAASSSVTLPEGGVLEQRVTHLCNRIPDLLERVDKASTRLAGDAQTKGSIAWLEAKQDQAQKSHHPKVANRLERVIERRTQRQAKLPELKQKLITAQGECATLDLPAPSPASTSS